MEGLNAQAFRVFVRSLEGAEVARILSISTFSLMVYEYFITLDDEVKFFWTGPWNTSRILFLSNRYLPPFIIILGLICFSTPHPTPEFCKPAIQACFMLNVLALGIIQAILVLRIWYLFSDGKVVRMIAISSFIASMVTSLYYASVCARDLRLLRSLTEVNIRGCRAARPEGFWRIFLPPLIIHTLLYILTAARALRNRRLLKSSPVLKRLLRDGGFFYFVVFFSVGFTAIGSFLDEVPELNTPAIYSNFVLASTSICVSRVMFSIHSLAAKLGSDSAWLLNNVELSRVAWRQGEREGELIVELDTAYDDDCDDFELGDVNSITKSIRSVKTTRVGMLDDDPYSRGPTW